MTEFLPPTCGTCQFRHRGSCHGLPPTTHAAKFDLNGEWHWDSIQARPRVDAETPGCSLHRRR